MSHNTHDNDLPDALAVQDVYLNPTIMGDYMIRTTVTSFPEPPGYKAIVSRRAHDGGETGPGSFVISVTSIYDTRQEALVRAISWLPDQTEREEFVLTTDSAPEPEEASTYVRQQRLLRQAATLLKLTVHDLLSDVLTLEVTAPEWSAYTVTEVRHLRRDCVAMATKLLHLAEEKAKQEHDSDIDDMPF